MKKFPIALQLYSVREQLKEDFIGTLRAVKEMGYDGVELVGLYGYSAQELKNMFQEIGLIPLAVHAGFPEMAADPDFAAAYKGLGCDYAIVSYLPPEFRPDSGRFDETIATLKEVIQHVEKSGLKLCYHNHDFEFQKIDDAYGLDILYKEIPDMMAELDSCWIKVAGEDPVKYIRKYAGRQALLHVKDFFGTKSADCRSDFEFRPVGYGVQNFREILLAAEEADVSWLIVEQDAPSLEKSALECAKMSIDYLKTLL